MSLENSKYKITKNEDKLMLTDKKTLKSRILDVDDIDYVIDDNQKLRDSNIIENYFKLKDESYEPKMITKTADYVKEYKEAEKLYSNVKYEDIIDKFIKKHKFSKDEINKLAAVPSDSTIKKFYTRSEEDKRTIINDFKNLQKTLTEDKKIPTDIFTYLKAYFKNYYDVKNLLDEYDPRERLDTFLREKGLYNKEEYYNVINKIETINSLKDLLDNHITNFAGIDLTKLYYVIYKFQSIKYIVDNDGGITYDPDFPKIKFKYNLNLIPSSTDGKGGDNTKYVNETLGFIHDYNSLDKYERDRFLEHLLGILNIKSQKPDMQGKFKEKYKGKKFKTILEQSISEELEIDKKTMSESLKNILNNIEDEIDGQRIRQFLMDPKHAFIDDDYEQQIIAKYDWWIDPSRIMEVYVKLNDEDKDIIKDNKDLAAVKSFKDNIMPYYNKMKDKRENKDDNKNLSEFIDLINKSSYNYLREKLTNVPKKEPIEKSIVEPIVGPIVKPIVKPIEEPKKEDKGKKPSDIVKEEGDKARKKFLDDEKEVTDIPIESISKKNKDLSKIKYYLTIHNTILSKLYEKILTSKRIISESEDIKFDSFNEFLDKCTGLEYFNSPYLVRCLIDVFNTNIRKDLYGMEAKWFIKNRYDNFNFDQPTSIFKSGYNGKLTLGVLGNSVKGTNYTNNIIKILKYVVSPTDEKGDGYLKGNTIQSNLTGYGWTDDTLVRIENINKTLKEYKKAQGRMDPHLRNIIKYHPGNGRLALGTDGYAYGWTDDTLTRIERITDSLKMYSNGKLIGNGFIKKKSWTKPMYKQSAEGWTDDTLKRIEKISYTLDDY